MTRERPHLLPVRGPIKTYAWGSRTFLGALAGRPTPTPEPEAELWIGAHRDGSAEVQWDGEWIALRDAIAREPDAFIGASGAARFGGELAYLLKALAIERPLSLQVHPDRAQARAGFERERAAGVALGEGSYRDPWPKPELLVALEPVWALHGLLEAAEIRRRFGEAGIHDLVPELDRLANEGVTGLARFLAALLGLAGERKSRVLAEARAAVERARARERAEDRREGSGEPGDSWRLWLRRLLELYPDDPAALAPLFLHVVELAPGQGLFQAPGVLHSYLAGAGVEVMASSDNVVRAGLTPKPVDVAELLRVVDPTPVRPARVEARQIAPGVASYAVEADVFELLRLKPPAAGAIALPFAGDSLLLALCTRGQGRAEAPERGERLALRSGDAFALRPGGGTLRLAGDLCVFAAITPPARIE